MQEKIKNYFLNLFFPQFCFLCKKEGDYLCEDCEAILEIAPTHQKHKTRYLSDLYYPLSYSHPLLKKLILAFKYEPFVKQLKNVLARLIVHHFQLLDAKPNFINSLIVAVPLDKKKLKWRGFNQAEEIAKELGRFLEIPFYFDVLIKIKSNNPQAATEAEQRRENVKNIFRAQNLEKIKNKNIILVDDVYTTGATMEECAKTLKENGAKEITGIVVARAKPGEDEINAVKDFNI